MKIQAPSLYWHFPNKQALLDGMADAIFGAVSLPRNLRGKAWDERLKAVMRAIRRAFLAHRDGARVFAGTYVPTDNVLRVVEAMMTLMQEAGASPKLSSDGAFSLVYYVLGFTMEEQGLDPQIGGPLDLANRQAKFANLAAMKYPSIHAALHRMFDNDLDDRFEAGLDLLINGLKARIDYPVVIRLSKRTTTSARKAQGRRQPQAEDFQVTFEAPEIISIRRDRLLCFQSLLPQRWQTDREQKCSWFFVRKWRAAADEDGQYCFAVAL